MLCVPDFVFACCRVAVDFDSTSAIPSFLIVQFRNLYTSGIERGPSTETGDSKPYVRLESVLSHSLSTKRSKDGAPERLC